MVRGNPRENLDVTAKHNPGTWIEVAWKRRANKSAKS